MSERKFISVELPRNWEEIDPNRMYHIITKFTFLSSDVNQAEHDLVANLCVALEKLTGREIKEESLSPKEEEKEFGKCKHCEKAIYESDIVNKTVEYHFIPDTAFTTEEGYWEHKDCKNDKI